MDVGDCVLVLAPVLSSGIVSVDVEVACFGCWRWFRDVILFLLGVSGWVSVGGWRWDDGYRLGDLVCVGLVAVRWRVLGFCAGRSGVGILGGFARSTSVAL